MGTEQELGLGQGGVGVRQGQGYDGVGAGCLCGSLLPVQHPVPLQELAASERAKRQAQQERDDLADELANGTSGK